jgi:Zn-dependent protease with chaperone function
MRATPFQAGSRCHESVPPSTSTTARPGRRRTRSQQVAAIRAADTQYREPGHPLAGHILAVAERRGANCSTVTADLTYQDCPECGHAIPVEKKFVAWCDQCEWNVDPLGEPYPPPAWRTRLEHRVADALYRELEHGRIQRPGWDVARVLAAVMSAVVLTLPIVCLALGVAALIVYRPVWLAVPIAAVPLGCAWLFRPRLHPLSKQANIIRREQAPRLYALLDTIADALGTERVSSVVIDAEPNLWFNRTGWRRRATVGIGLPMWFSLDPQQRVAVLAHELGHGKHGDARHDWLAWNASAILDHLIAIFSPRFGQERIDPALRGDEARTSVAIMTINTVVGGAISAYAWALTRTHLRGSQRAEYLADRRAAEIAGSLAAASALERTLLAETGYRTLERALRFEPGVDPLEAVGRTAATVPGREIDRRLRASKLRETRTDSSHPPTHLRCRLLRARPLDHPTLIMEPAAAAAVDAEIAAAGKAVLHELRRSFPS